MKVPRRPHPLFLAASLILLGSWLRPAIGQLLGPEFQVNSYTTYVQEDPAVAADGLGNFVVVWNGSTQDGSSYGVFGQLFDPSGGRVGSEFQVNTFTTGWQGSPAVATNGPGNFVVTWASSDWDGSGQGIVAQRFDASGTKVGNEFQVNTYTTSNQSAPAIAADGLGNFVVVWQSYLQDGFGEGLFGQRFDTAGIPIGLEFQVNSHTTDDQKAAKVAADSAGNFVVVWENYGQYGSNMGVFGQRFDSLGTKVGSEFSWWGGGVPAVAVDGTGNSIVVWVGSYGQDGSGWGAFGQRFNSGGAAVGSEFQVNTYTTSGQNVPRVAADALGRFVVVWNSAGQDGASYGVFGQRFDSAGIKVGSEFQVNTFTTSGQFFPVVAADGSGNFVVAWGGVGQHDSWGVAAKQLTTAIFADGLEAGDACAWSAAEGGGC